MPLRNEDYTDRELLHLIADCADAEGIATSEDIAAALGYGSTNGVKPATKVVTRLAWMTRFGMLARVELQKGQKGSRWILTDLGRALMGGRLRKTVEDALDTLDPGSAVLTMRHLTRRAYVEAQEEVATAVRREYLHQSAKRHTYDGGR